MPERRPAAERLQCLTGKDLDEACQAARVQGPGCLGLARGLLGAIHARNPLAKPCGCVNLPRVGIAI